MGLESIIGDLPLGIAIVLVLEGPWVALVISGKLQWISRMEKEIARIQEAHEAEIARLEAQHGRELLAARQDVTYYREGQGLERARADKATEKMAEVSREVGASMIHLLDSLPHSGDKLSPEQSAGGR